MTEKTHIPLTGGTTAETFPYASAEKSKQKAMNKPMENVLKSILGDGE